MKKYLLAITLLPVFGHAQVKSKPAPKKAAVAKPQTVIAAQKADDEFIINGNISGLADGTTLKMLNGSTGGEEQTVITKNGKFSFRGKTTTPDFKLIGVNGQPPYITIFIDNSIVTVTGTKDNLENAEIKGSASQDDFATFANATKPYQDLIMGKGRFTPEDMDKGASVIEKFITAHESSYITPLAIFRYDQITGDYAKLEEMYNDLAAPVKTTLIGNYLMQQIAQNKQVAYGKPVSDFSQPDTSGKAISLSSFKGRYVLVDFWASWCGPCRAENPNVVNTFAEFKDKNFTVLSVSLDKAKQSWVDAIAADRLAWTNVSDLQAWNNAAAQQFGITSIPQNMLIDPDGNLIGKNLRGAALEYRLSKVLR